ncbi:peptide ABC transporter substrate-binding protein [Microseira wollei]|uniref:Uncharacterized protein n=1 Tax=Microseira wollei NIES-4236 TaxID=2530354 RepID=A0AAV3XI82_9CYAN|nr:peptide ABC transporter substrate-binding protein [Microseira wollei]GET40147.1 hypothetical protein MiSe_49550 [Microseira wollei NIES-4236]
MNKSFFLQTAPTPTFPSLLGALGDPMPGKIPVRILVISTPFGVNQTIHTLHALRFADVSLWSPLLPAPNPGEVMSILTRYLTL